MSTSPILLAQQRSFAVKMLRRVLAVGVVGGAGLFLFIAAAGHLLLLAAGTAVAIVLAWAAWRWPIAAAVVFVALAPVHRFLLLLVHSATESGLVLKAFQGWKDAVILILLARVIHEAFTRRRAPRLHFLDLLVLTFLILGAVYVLYPGTLSDSSLMSRLLAFRFDALFLLAYFVGRGLTVNRNQVRMLFLAAVPASIAVVLVAFWQWIATDQANALFESLGFSDFMRAVGGTGEMVVRSRDLTDGAIPRASSLLLGDLALAFYALFAVALAAAVFFSVRERWQQCISFTMLLGMSATLLLTTTRSAIIAAAAVILFLTIWTRSYLRVGYTLLALGTLASMFVLLSGLTADSILELFSSQELSVLGHSKAAEMSFEIMREEPLGRGLGSAGPIAQRLAVSGAITNESWYLQLATEMGVFAALLFGAITLLTSISALSAWAKVKDSWHRYLTLGVASASLGYIIVGAVLHVWEVSHVSAVFWLFAGIAIRAPQLEQEWTLTGVTDSSSVRRES